MKKLILFLSIILMPLNVFAYSDYIYRGGNTLGIEIECDGILIVGFYQIDGEFNKGNPKLKVGDYIKKVNGVTVNNLKQLSKEIEKYTKDGKVKITFIRDKKENTTTLELINNEGIYKTGLYVKDSITGIGTLTYIDPNTLIYGALGHEIIESNTNQKVEVKTGKIFSSEITGTTKSDDNVTGEKNAIFNKNIVYGDIKENTTNGIFGTYTSNINQDNLIEIADKTEITKGEAKIYTVLKNNEVKEYTINILKINTDTKTKNILFEITDEELMKSTNGVIKGMSGSPIVQNNKLIGAVTHAIVNDNSKGYGIFITTMLEEGEN